MKSFPELRYVPGAGRDNSPGLGASEPVPMVLSILHTPIFSTVWGICFSLKANSIGFNTTSIYMVLARSLFEVHRACAGSA